jgi:hypothetical protein
VGSHKIDYAYGTLRLHHIKRLFGRVVTMDVMRYNVLGKLQVQFLGKTNNFTDELQAS